jgi:hypothetical protein
MRIAGLVAAATLLTTGVCFAQQASTGSLHGRVTDPASGGALAGVTVVATGPQGDQAEITDDSGSYVITGLTPGMYVVRFYFGNAKVERQNVQVFADKTIQVNVALQANTTEKYQIVTRAPTLDTRNTKTSVTVGQEYTRNVPVGGRNFESLATVAPGAQTDGMGVSFAGTTSAENNYVIDGTNVTSIHMSQAATGAASTQLNTDFIQEVEVITGAYNAEYGRATGGLVNVVTKSGSNEFHGDAAFYYDPGSLHGVSPRIVFPGQSISTEVGRNGGDYRMDFFADLGGPIIKDRLFFYVGIEPVLVRATQRRFVSSLVDKCTQSDGAQAGPCTGGPDGYQDFVGGQYQVNDLYHTDLENTSTQLQWSGKLNLLVSPDHTLQLSYFGTPNTTETHRALGTPIPSRVLGGAQDASAQWVSKLFDKKWQIEAAFSYHHERTEHELVDPVETQPSVVWQTDPVADTLSFTDRQGGGPSLSWFASQEGKNAAAVLAGCDMVSLGTTTTRGSVTPVDPQSKLKSLCPVTNYADGSNGGWENLLAERFGTRLAGTNFFRAAGHHQLMYGWDFERNLFHDTRIFAGAGLLQVFQSGSSKFINQRGWGYLVDLSAGATSDNIRPYPIKRDAQYNPVLGANGEPVADLSQCQRTDDIPSGSSVFCADTATDNHALFLRDSWNLLPNLTLNLGIRWERQAIGGVNDFENTVLGGDSIVIDNNWAPRIGVVYDPTNEGKAKVYGSFARFYESIPLDINNRSFGREGYQANVYDYRDSSRFPGCRNDLIGATSFSCSLNTPRLFGGEKSLVEPGLNGMYTDEMVLGGEYEILEDLALGGYYTHRQLGTIIEDGSVDNASNYYITNPGESVSQGQLKTLTDRADAARNEAVRQMAAGNMVLANDLNHLATRLDTFADTLPYFGQFAKPQRDYNALTITARKRFSKSWLAMASYTYARTIGNYPGIYNPYIAQQDPNISQMYDLPDLLTNRVGPLPNDIPHQFKLDGYYTFRLTGDSSLVTGTSLRAQSGGPRNVLGVNQIYAPFPENFLLPSGSGGRNDFTTSWDLQLAWVRQLPRNMQLQIFFSAFNVLNTQNAVTRNDVYSLDFTAPVVDGSMKDLEHLKTVAGTVAKPNASFGSATAYQPPLFTRFGARFTF